MKERRMDKTEKMINHLRQRKLRIVLFSAAFIVFSILAIWGWYVLYTNEKMAISEWTQSFSCSNERERNESIWHLGWSFFYSRMSPILFISSVAHGILAGLCAGCLISELTGYTHANLLVRMYDEIQELKRKMDEKPNDLKSQ